MDPALVTPPARYAARAARVARIGVGAAHAAAAGTVVRGRGVGGICDAARPGLVLLVGEADRAGRCQAQAAARGQASCIYGTLLHDVGRPGAPLRLWPVLGGEVDGPCRLRLCLRRNILSMVSTWVVY